MAVFPRKLKRDLLIDGGLEVTGNSTLTGAVTAAGGVAVTGTLTGSAIKGGLVLSTGGYLAEHVQSLNDYAALTDTGGSSKAGYQAILGYGVTKIAVTGTSGTTAGSTANDLVFKLSSPAAVGVHKFVFVSGASASTKEVRIRTQSSLQTFYGSTYNQVTWSTAINNPSDALHLIGLATGASAGAWALVNRKLSTAASLAGATA